MPHLPRTVTVVFAATSAVVLAALPGPSASGDALPAQPYGAFEQLDSPTGGYVHFRGWAVDPADPGGSVTVLLTNGPGGPGVPSALYSGMGLQAPQIWLLMKLPWRSVRASGGVRPDRKWRQRR